MFARTPDVTEKQTLLAFLDSHTKVIQSQTGEGNRNLALPVGLKQDETGNPVREAAFVDLVHAVVNSSDFAYKF